MRRASHEGPDDARRLRTVLFAAILGCSALAVEAAPTDIPLPRPEALTPQPVKALACADGPAFSGRLTSSKTSTTAITRSTTGNVYGYISNVNDDWSCDAYIRYDGLAWVRDDGDDDGNFDWGTIINSTSVPCNWTIGTTNYLKANSTTDCPDSDAEYAMPIHMDATSAGATLEAIFHNDLATTTTPATSCSSTATARPTTAPRRSATTSPSRAPTWAAAPATTATPPTSTG